MMLSKTAARNLMSRLSWFESKYPYQTISRNNLGVVVPTEQTEVLILIEMLKNNDTNQNLAFNIDLYSILLYDQYNKYEQALTSKAVKYTTTLNHIKVYYMFTTSSSQLLSFQGALMSVQIHIVDNLLKRSQERSDKKVDTFSTQAVLKLYWLDDNYENVNDVSTAPCTPLSTQKQYVYCLNYSMTGKDPKFTLFLRENLGVGKIFEFYLLYESKLKLEEPTGGDRYKKPLNISRSLRSWNEGNNLCQSAGGHLPHFNSEEELDEFIALIKLSPYVPPIEAVFVGLKYRSVRQVSSSVTIGLQPYFLKNSSMELEAI